MGKDDMARVLVAVMDAGEISEFDMRDAQEAHLALVFLSSSPAGESACIRMRAPVVALPDPDVGLRVRGLTQALWSAVGMDLLLPAAGGSLVTLTRRARREGRTLRAGLSEAERVAVVEAGQRWANRSASLNVRDSAAASPVVV